MLTTKSVLNIGPAGETLLSIAAVMNDTERATRRSGVSSIIGSKNLKVHGENQRGYIKEEECEGVPLA